MKTHIYYRDEVKASIAEGVVIAALCGHTQTVAGAPNPGDRKCARCRRVLAKIRPGETARAFKADATTRVVTTGPLVTYSWTADAGPTIIPPAA